MGLDRILLLRNIPPLELARARESIALIEARGYSQDKPLRAMLKQYLEDANAPPNPNFREVTWPRGPRKN